MPDLSHHSGRKTTVYNSGHKNIRSITSYSTISQKQQLNMSHTLTGLSSGEIAPQSGSSILGKRSMSWTSSNILFNFFSAKQASSTAPFSFFSGAIITGG